jgi:hypothetical protein
VSDLDELRALVREVIRDVLPQGLPVTETVNLSSDEDLAAFVDRLLDLDPEAREEIRSGRKRFRLAAPGPRAPGLRTANGTAWTAGHPARPGGAAAGGAAAGGAAAGGAAAGGAGAGPPVRRVERGAVTEKVIRDAVRAGERLVLGPGAVLTPLARDRARASGVEISKER